MMIQFPHTGRLSAAALLISAGLALTACSVPAAPPAPTAVPAEPQFVVVTATGEPTAVVQPTAEAPAQPTAAPAEPTAVPPTEVPPPTAASGAPAPVTANLDWEPVTAQFQGITWLLVPPGCFQMGDKDGFTEETPQQEQCFDEPFWIAATETTNRQYGSQGNWAGDNAPRDDVTWEQAQKFCQSVGGRLPTEKEWEYAARGPSSWKYTMGDTLEPGYVIHAGNARGAAEVGSLPDGQSWVGALDMLGNLREWTNSAWAPYPYDPTDGREDDPSREARRTVRGGSFQFGTDRLRASYREFYDRNSSTGDIGFRCAADYGAITP